MKRLIFTATLCFGMLATAIAQKANVGVNLAGALPMGDLSNASNFGYAGDVSFDYYFSDNFDLGLEVGYRRFGYSYESFGLDGEGINLVPVLITPAFHTDIDDWMDFYGELGVGMYFGESRSAPENGDFASFGASPRVGIAFELTPTVFFDLNVNYNYVMTDAYTETYRGTEYTLVPENLQYLGLNVGLLYTIQEW